MGSNKNLSLIHKTSPFSGTEAKYSGGEPWGKCNFVHPAFHTVQPRGHRALVWHLVECRRIFQLRVLPQLVCYPFGVASFQKITFWLFLIPKNIFTHRFIFKKRHKQHPATAFHQSWHLFVGLPQPLQVWPHLGLLVAADECRGDWSWTKTCASRESGGSHLTSGPLAEDLAGDLVPGW